MISGVTRDSRRGGGGGVWASNLRSRCPNELATEIIKEAFKANLQQQHLLNFYSTSIPAQ